VPFSIPDRPLDRRECPTGVTILARRGPVCGRAHRVVLGVVLAEMDRLGPRRDLAAALWAPPPEVVDGGLAASAVHRIPPNDLYWRAGSGRRRVAPILRDVLDLRLVLWREKTVEFPDNNPKSPNGVASHKFMESRPAPDGVNYGWRDGGGAGQAVLGALVHASVVMGFNAYRTNGSPLIAFADLVSRYDRTTTCCRRLRRASQISRASWISSTSIRMTSLPPDWSTRAKPDSFDTA
jgi:hypothetical protein